MFGVGSLLAAFAVSLVLGLLWLVYKKRTYPNATAVDKKFWVLQMHFAIMGFLWIVFAGNILNGPYSMDFDSDDTQDRKIEKLIQNDKRRTEAAERFQYTTFIFLMLVGGSMMSMANVVNAIQKGRDKQLLEENPETKKPLGLS